jgi:hypothetical protein
VSGPETWFRDFPGVFPTNIFSLSSRSRSGFVALSPVFSWLAPNGQYALFSGGNQIPNNHLLFYSEKIGERVSRARARQLERFRGPNFFANAQMGTKEIKKFWRVPGDIWDNSSYGET